MICYNDLLQYNKKFVRDVSSEKFKDKYRIASARLQGFDYGSNGAYFVTINTKNRESYFGKIVNGIMGLSEMGCQAWKCWYEIPNHFPFVILDEFVVMPDHVHGVIFIDKTVSQPIPMPTVETQDFASLPNHKITNKFGPQSKNLASIIRGFKIGVTKFIHEHDVDFTWQPRFHDRIIRNEGELNRIRQYIKDNPNNWRKP